MIQDYEVNRLEAIRRIVGGRVSGRNDGSVVSFLDGQKAPSKTDVDKKLKELQAEWDSQEYARKRALEYPSIEELVVALYDTDDKSAIEAKRAEVKKKYPKP